MVSVEGILPWKSLVVQVCPVAATAGNGILGDEATGVSRAKEAGESEGSHVGVPVVAPVVGSVEILFEVILKTEAVGNSRQ